MSAYDCILYEVSGAVALVAMNRPDALNAFDDVQRRELAAALKAANEDPAVRVIVLAGEGRAFSAGADLKSAKPGRDVEASLMTEYKPAMDQVMKGEKPVIVAAHGACAGIGASFVMAGDLAVMEEDAYLYQAFANIGLIPDGAAHWHLARALGRKRAYELIVFAGRMTAQEALAAGLVNQIVPKGEARTAAMALAAKLAEGAPRTQKYAKQALLAAETGTYDEVFALEAKLQANCVGSQDNVDAVAAFLRKEKPVFTGA